MAKQHLLMLGLILGGSVAFQACSSDSSVGKTSTGNEAGEAGETGNGAAGSGEAGEAGVAAGRSGACRTAQPAGGHRHCGRRNDLESLVGRKHRLRDRDRSI